MIWATACARWPTEPAADALGDALVEAALGAGAWDGLPEPVRRLPPQRRGALADLEGVWLDADPEALAAIRQPVLLVAAADSQPMLREPNSMMAAALPGAGSETVGGGHLIDPADPLVLAFVEDVLSAAPSA